MPIIFPFNQIVRILIVVMPAILGLFMMILLLAHFVTNLRILIRFRTKVRVLRFIKVVRYREQISLLRYGKLNPLAEDKIYNRLLSLRNNCGIFVLEKLIRELNSEQMPYLKKIILAPRYMKYLKRKIQSSNLASALLISKIIGELQLIEYAPYVEKLLARHGKRVEVQYTCCMCLAKLGQAEALINYFHHAATPLGLSFRMLQEIFDEYQGNRLVFVQQLLQQSTDNYIKRSCIKSIGKNGLVELIPLIMPYLDEPEGNLNFIIDTMRALGQLQAKDAGPIIANYASTTRFEIKIAIIYALSNIDLNSYVDTIINFLFDARWAVRYRAAQALVQYDDKSYVFAKIREKKDRYASEIFAFMLDQQKIMKARVRV